MVGDYSVGGYVTSLMHRASQIEGHIVDIRRRIHQQPELSLQEFKTTALLEQELQRYGIDTIRSGFETGVVGLLKGSKPGKVIGIRADIDALPLTEDTGLPYASQVSGVCHACGHVSMLQQWLGVPS